MFSEPDGSAVHRDFPLRCIRAHVVWWVGVLRLDGRQRRILQWIQCAYREFSKSFHFSQTCKKLRMCIFVQIVISPSSILDTNVFADKFWRIFSWLFKFIIFPGETVRRHLVLAVERCVEATEERGRTAAQADIRQGQHWSWFSRLQVIIIFILKLKLSFEFCCITEIFLFTWKRKMRQYVAKKIPSSSL